jgi:hypothetical protein
MSISGTFVTNVPLMDILTWHYVESKAQVSYFPFRCVGWFSYILPKLPVSESFSWAENVESSTMTYTTPTKHPRDIFALLSSQTNPFSSLHCRTSCNSRKSRHFSKFWPQSNIQHTLSSPCYHNSIPYSPRHLSQPHFTVSLLDWDQDPCLADLSNALRALGWVRR